MCSKCVVNRVNALQRFNIDCTMRLHIVNALVLWLIAPFASCFDSLRVVNSLFRHHIVHALVRIHSKDSYSTCTIEASCSKCTKRLS